MRGLLLITAVVMGLALSWCRPVEAAGYQAMIDATLARLPAADVALIDAVELTTEGDYQHCGWAYTLDRRVVLSLAPVCGLAVMLPHFLAHEVAHMRQAADGWPNQWRCPGPTPPNLPLSGGGYCWQLDEPEAEQYARLHGF